jgi:hypothetical protein
VEKKRKTKQETPSQPINNIPSSTQFLIDINDGAAFGCNNGQWVYNDSDFYNNDNDNEQEFKNSDLFSFLNRIQDEENENNESINFNLEDLNFDPFLNKVELQFFLLYYLGKIGKRGYNAVYKLIHQIFPHHENTNKISSYANHK